MARGRKHPRLFWRNYVGGSNDERHSPEAAPDPQLPASAAGPSKGEKQMKPMGAPSVPPRPLSRRRFLLNGATLTTAVLTPGILGLTSLAAGETPMDMNGARGVPRAPYDKDAPAHRAGGPPLGQRRAANDLARPLCLQGHRRLSALAAHLRRHDPGPHLARAARATCCASAWSTICRRTPTRAARHGAAAPFQHDQLPLPRLACQPGRNLRQHLPLDGAGAELRHRDRHPGRSSQRAPIGITRTTTAAPMSR